MADTENPAEFDCTGRPIQFTIEQRTRKGRKDCQAWIAPPDMPDYMVLDVLNGVICGALAGGEGDDKYCRSIPVAGIDRTKPVPWRCKKHGGIPENKARPGNENARTFGMYASCLSEDEKKLRNEAYADGVDNEIAVLRVRLKRALDAENASQHELESWTEETSQTGTGKGDDAKEKVVLKKTKTYRNRATAVDRIVRQLARMVGLKRFNTMALFETTPEGVRVYLPDNGRDTSQED